jgi:hypothetical protein
MTPNYRKRELGYQVFHRGDASDIDGFAHSPMYEYEHELERSARSSGTPAVLHYGMTHTVRRRWLANEVRSIAPLCRQLVTALRLCRLRAVPSQRSIIAERSLCFIIRPTSRRRIHRQPRIQRPFMLHSARVDSCFRRRSVSHELG